MTNTLIHGIIDALSGSVSKEVIVDVYKRQMKKRKRKIFPKLNKRKKKNRKVF